MEATSGISMCLIITTLVSTIFLSSFASQAPVNEDSKLANADDFFSSGLHARDIPVPGFNVTHAVIDGRKIPLLKSIGMAVIHVDFEPLGRSPIHYHTYTSELMYVLEGTLYVGFLIPGRLGQGKFQLISKILHPGDVFVVPQGHVHFLYNMGHNASCQLYEYFNNVDVYVANLIPSPIFASDPPIDDDFLAKIFRMDKSEIEDLRKKFPY